MAGIWERLTDYAHELGPDPELAGMTDQELDRSLVSQAVTVTAQTARWIVLVSEVVVRGMWVDTGAKTPGEWLSWRVGLAPTTARDHVRVGLALRTLPTVRSRFLAGTLSYSKVRAITRDEHGCPLDVGRSQRASTSGQRKALLRRDGGCRFPGCMAASHLHAHHAREWGHGGRTDLDNLILLCSFHHRFVHNAAWSVDPLGHGVFAFRDTAGEVVVARQTAHDSAESPGALPVVTARTTSSLDSSLQPRWWDGDLVDWDLCVFVLSQKLLERAHQEGRHLAIAQAA